MTNTITIVGNLTADPEIRFIPNGAAVANFTVAYNQRTFDKHTQEWKDGESLFLRCNIWREAAEHVAESLTRGMRVIVTGRLKQRSWEQDGQKRSTVELEVEEIGPSLKNATAKVDKTAGNGPRRDSAPQTPDPVADDPWGTATDEAPPF